MPAVAFAAPLAPVPDGVLVTGAEASDFMGDAGFNQVAPRTRSLVPAIEILLPQIGADRKVATAFPISVRFRSQADAAMVPSTLKVLYGASRVDITSRIVKPGQVTPEGFTSAQVQVPRGQTPAGLPDRGRAPTDGRSGAAL